MSINNPWAGACIWQSFSGLLSVLFRTTRSFQELLFKLLLQKLLTNFQIKTISNQITSPLFTTLNLSYVKMTTPLKFKKVLNIFVLFVELQDILKFMVCQISWGKLKSFSRVERSHGQIQRSKYFHQMSKLL